MKKLSPKLAILFFAVLFSAGAVFAQDAPPKQDFADQPLPGRQRPNLLRELGLSREQIQQIRRANQERKPRLDEATLRVRNARRDLDVAIYSDTLNEDDLRAKLKEFQIAQAEAAKIRLEGEVAIRKVLTPEQLVRFRELRQRFAEAAEDFRNRPPTERQRFRQQMRRQQPPVN
jgi:Spy/CpxP family protein refolding chaperone